MLFICYPKCSTCQKAKAWLEKHNLSFTERHIVTETPTKAELKSWLSLSHKPLKSFFNTSGLLYRRLNLSSKLPAMPESEQLDLLTANGILIKRPLLITADHVLIGFREKEWADTLLK